MTQHLRQAATEAEAEEPARRKCAVSFVSVCVCCRHMLCALISLRCNVALPLDRQESFRLLHLAKTHTGGDRDNNMRHVIAVKFYCSHVAYWEKQHDAAKEEVEVEVAKARRNKDSTVAAKTKESKTRRRKSNRRVRCASFFP